MYKNFNPKFFHDHEEILTANEQLVFDKKVEANKNTRPKEEDFKDIYSELEIKNDQAELKRLKDKDDFIPPTMKSMILEKVMEEQIEMSAWLGDCVALKTTEYDDIKNGTDLVVEIKNDDKDPVRLSIDVSVTENQTTVDSKVDKMLAKLKNGQGTNIKYFESELSDDKGRLKQIPKLFIILDNTNFTNLCDLVGEKIKGDISKKDIEDDAYQFVLLEELIDQLKSQLEYLDTEHGEPVKQSDIYKNILQALNKLTEINQKKVKHGSLNEPRAGLDRIVHINF